MDAELLGALFLLVALWLAAIVGGVMLLDRLFPRIERSDDEYQPQFPQLAARRRILTAPVAKAAPAAEPLPAWGAQYWRATLALILPLLLVWAAGTFLPAIFAPALNRIQILTGFPLGYYMGSQGALIVFIALTVIYTWRMSRLDRRFGAPTVLSGDHRSQLVRGYLLFTLGFIGFALVMAWLELQLSLPQAVIGWSFLLLTLGIYTVIGLRSRAHSLDDYYVAGRQVPGFFNGLATGSDWMSAASFLSMAGTLWALGYEGLAYIMGWTGGYVLLVLLLAPYLRKFGRYTIPDFIGARYPGSPARVTAALIAIVISFTYVAAQVAGIGIIMSRFLGVNYMIGVVVGLLAVLLCSFLGGMRAVTWTQVAQGIILVTAYLVPVIMIAVRFTGVPLPQLMYGEALREIERLELEQGITRSYAAPFNDWTPANFLALTVCLMLGTAGLPHILVRFYTAASVRDARSSVSWALVWICLLYFTAPAYAAFSRWEVLQNVVGKPISELPAWTKTWSRTGLLHIADEQSLGGNDDGILQYNELDISQDLVVLATPEIAGLPYTVAALVAAGGLAAALSTADGLLMVIASAVAHDIYYGTINPRASPRSRLLLGRLLVLVAAGLAAIVATQRLGIIVQLVSWAFSLAAATFFPVLVLGIFWKRSSSAGAVAGMVCGALVTLGYMALNYIHPGWHLFGIDHVAAGIFGVPVNFLVTMLVSLRTAAPPPEVQALVETLRTP